jgi:AcrR family transcriptional regulator
MDGFARRKQHSKEEILKAAAELFSQFGIVKVSLEDVARKASVSKATIYNNYGSKENLVKDYVLTTIDTVIKRGREILNSKMSYNDKLEAFFQQIFQITTHPITSETENFELPPHINLFGDPNVKIIHDSVMQKFGDLLVEFIHEGKKQGRVKADLSEEAVKVLFSVLQKGFIDPEIHPRFHREPELVKDLFSLLIYGLSGKSVKAK